MWGGCNADQEQTAEGEDNDVQYEIKRKRNRSCGRHTEEARAAVLNNMKETN